MSAEPQPQLMNWEDAVRWLRDQPYSHELVRACYYDDPLPLAAERYRSSPEWQSLRTIWRDRTGTALDVGAGRGIATYALARDGWQVTALEPNNSTLVGSGAIRALASSANISVTIEERWGESLPFKDNSFDLVFARAVLHHARDLRAMCMELSRVARPGGLVVAIREHVISRHSDLPAFQALHPLHRLYGGEHAYLRSEYVGALKAAGLDIIHDLRPLSSPINLAPMTYDRVWETIAQRIGAIPAIGPIASVVTRIPGVATLAMTLASYCDNRPGRLHSFVCRKPK